MKDTPKRGPTQVGHIDHVVRAEHMRAPSPFQRFMDRTLEPAREITEDDYAALLARATSDLGDLPPMTLRRVAVEIHEAADNVREAIARHLARKH